MSDDRETSIHDLKEAMREFSEARDWDQFHNAKDLAIGISTEASEVLEHFRFKNANEVEEMMKDPVAREEIGDELADVLTFTLRMCQRYDIDMTEAFHRKLGKSAVKYPVERSKGRADKYTVYESD
ncbi:MAG: NTP pyrophosphatase (non-canonical NTP hydrolase) [Patescibacteria group bacterium]|jgi:NTP pyrophosphatase (non-canonical NTP hydrolase)